MSPIRIICELPGTTWHNTVVRPLVPIVIGTRITRTTRPGSCCAVFGRAIKAGTYRAGPTKTVKIAKSSGSGTRTLRLANIEDRVVQRAVLQILQPWVDPTFDEYSFGYRPHRDRRHALATAELLTHQRNLTTWLVDDIANCFDQIPRSRLFQTLARRWPENIVELVERTCDPHTKRGVTQGAPCRACW